MTQLGIAANHQTAFSQIINPRIAVFPIGGDGTDVLKATWINGGSGTSLSLQITSTNPKALSTNLVGIFVDAWDHNAKPEALND